MALRAVLPPPPEVTKSDRKSQFENRLRLIKEKVPGHIKKKEEPTKGYTLWRIFSDSLVVRAYKEVYTLHTNGDIDHYEIKRVAYKDVKYEVDDMKFIANLLDDVQ